jgi:hypothetical protein
MKRKHHPPLKRTQLGVQMRFTIGQRPDWRSIAPSTKQLTEASRSRFRRTMGRSPAFSQFPAMSPRMTTSAIISFRSERVPSKEKQGIAETELGKRILECPVGLRTMHGAEEDTQQDQQQGSPHVMPQHPARGLPPGRPARDGEWQGYTNQKGEGGLDEVVKGATQPWHMTLMIPQELPESAFRKGLSHLCQLQHLGHHQEHHQSPVGIDGRNAFPRCGKW